MPIFVIDGHGLTQSVSCYIYSIEIVSVYCLLIHSLSNTLRGDPHLLPKADPVKHQQVCVNN